MIRIASVVLVTCLFAGSAYAQNPVARGRQEFVDSNARSATRRREGNKKGPVLTALARS